MKNILAIAKNSVVANKTAIAVAATAVTYHVIYSAALKNHNEFLKKHDLFDAFYNLKA